MRRLLTVFATTLLPLGYLVACAVLGALLAYPLFLLFQGSVNFTTLVNRGSEILLIAGLIPLARRIRLTTPEIGLAGNRYTVARQLRRGLVAGVLMMTVHMLLLLGFEARTFDYEKLEVVRLIRLSLKALAIGTAVACIEEPLFRGFFLGSLLRKTDRLSAALISSFYFAGLHFLKTDMKPAPGDIHWDTGLLLVLDAFQHLPQASPDGFLALFLAGTLLACVRLWKPLGLGYCIGLHMGWVFVIKAVKPFTHGGKNPLIPGLTSNYDGIIGSLSAGWTLVLIALLLPAICRRASLPAASGS